jgi:hypothetical protein
MHRHTENLDLADLYGSRDPDPTYADLIQRWGGRPDEIGADDLELLEREGAPADEVADAQKLGELAGLVDAYRSPEKIEIRTERDGKGYSYEGRVNGRLVVGGWSRGTRNEAIKEAREALRERRYTLQ